MKQEELNEIVESHVKWLYGDGKRADLAGADLHGADLDRANLRGADLYGADLHGANLSGAILYRADLYGANLRGANLYGASLYRANLYRANLSGADLYGASLRGADMSEANLHGANLCGADLYEARLYGADLSEANLCGADLPTGMYQVVGAGSCNRSTTYDTINDQVVCGCWYDGKGNHLDSFIDRVESIYGPNGENPNSVHYTEYMAAIDFFRAMKQLKENQDRQRNESFR